MARNAPVPPHNIELEQAILGACVNYPDQAIPAMVDEGVGEETFHRLTHRDLWLAIMDLHCRQEPVDALTVAAHLADPRAAGMIDSLGVVPGLGSIRYYARTLIDLEDWRATLAAGQELVAAAHARDERRRADAFRALVAVKDRRAARVAAAA